MDKVRITNPLGTEENEYQAPVAISVNGQVWGPVVVPQVDTAKLTQGNVNPGSSVSIPAIPQGASELGILTVIWNGKVDAAGNLLGKDGQIITEPENTDPLPTKFAGVEALLQWQADHPYYKNPFLVDGTPVGQAGFGAPSGFGSTADGSLIALQANPQPVPVTPLPEITDASDQFYQIAAPASGQVLTRTSGLTTGYAVFEFTVPKPYPFQTAGKLGFLRVTERPGSDVIPRAMTVYVGGAVAFSNYDSGDTAPSVDISIGGKHSGAMVGLEPGDVVRVAVRNVGYRPGHPADILFDLALPGR